MITIVELPEYLKKADKLLTPEERKSLQEYIARNPKAGVLIKETGGLRKLRWARKGMGKSGGVRVVYFYYNEKYPVFIITVFGKNEKSNLTKAERNILATLTALLLESYDGGKK